MGGSQSKDTDQTLTSLIQDADGAQVHLRAVPGRRRSRRAVRRRPHRSEHEQSEREYRPVEGGRRSPRSACSARSRLQDGPKVTATMGWGGHSDLQGSWHPDRSRSRCRAPYGCPAGVPAEAVAYYADVLKKVSETPEWKEYIERTSQTNRFIAGADLKSFIASDDAKNRKVFEQEGWVVR